MDVFVINAVQYLFFKKFEAIMPRCISPKPENCLMECPHCQNIMSLAQCQEFKTLDDKQQFKYTYDE